MTPRGVLTSAANIVVVVVVGIDVRTPGAEIETRFRLTLKPRTLPCSCRPIRMRKTKSCAHFALEEARCSPLTSYVFLRC